MLKKFLLLLCLTMGTSMMFGQSKSELHDLISTAFAEGRNQDAIALLNKGISQNDGPSYGRLAACYMNGIGVEQNIEKARYYAKKGSALRNSFSSLILGYTYLLENADDLFKGLELAVPYLKDAFICDDEESDESLYANAIGMIALHECNLENFDECREWLEAGLTDYPDDVSLNDQAAWMYLHMEDYPNAVKCAKVGSASESINSDFVLGWCMLYGNGIAKDTANGFKKIRKAALIGNSTAPMVTLAECYYEGLGTPVDKAKAKEWYEKAASMGDAEASEALSSLFKTKAATPVKKSAEQLVHEGDSLFNNKNYSAALSLYKEAVAAGNTDYAHKIGYMYRDGIGTMPDFPEAVKWFKLAAEYGNPGAQTDLGRMHETGRGTKQDYVEAFYWYRKAAEQNEKYAQFNLGGFYQRGIGVAQDYSEAIKWYTKAANQGLANAQCNLGLMYYFGSGVPADKQKAKELLEKAAAQGNVDAANNLKKLSF